MVDNIIIYLLAPVVPIIVAYVLGRKMKQKKDEVDVEKLQGKNYKIYIEAYQVMLDDLAKRNEASIQSNREQRAYHHKVVDELKETINDLSNSNRQLHKDIQKLKKDYPCPDCKISPLKPVTTCKI